jgi:predicted transposase YbfD/YdcC
MNADEIYRRLRGHRSIETNPHWCMEVMFEEDGARVSWDHAPGKT